MCDIAVALQGLVVGGCGGGGGGGVGGTMWDRPGARKKPSSLWNGQRRKNRVEQSGPE